MEKLNIVFVLTVMFQYTQQVWIIFKKVYYRNEFHLYGFYWYVIASESRRNWIKPKKAAWHFDKIHKNEIHSL